ncbi:hypothetical protein SAMN02745126_03217 [Enhydrobacter aerosaccus]|uniref:Uncharacterized protein n=1 Tax=Enhydrobacter aerosaccus TaxID=225324 RepID=A0A1T4QGT1_9HYPH|nr:hypothetical protein [Enhydrobacter aerosaccus]SKA02902.1 hypothetical protein SAMN02745126_03217 [Enhydrobacter aerosaccus]
MEREVAEKIMVAMKQVELALGELHIAVDVVESESERKQMIRLLGDIIHNLHVQVTLPVARRYPDLHPDGYSRTY